MVAPQLSSIKATTWGVVLLTCAASGGRADAAEPTPLRALPAAVFLEPAYEQVHLSPDGTELAFLRHDERHVAQLWVRGVDRADERALTHEPERSILSFQWSVDGRALDYVRGEGAPEGGRWVRVSREGAVKVLAPELAVEARLASGPTAVLATVASKRGRGLTDVARIELSSGATTTVAENPGDVLAWVADAALEVRAALAVDRLGARELRVRDGVKRPWRTLSRVEPDDRLEPLGFSPDGRALRYLSSKDAKAARIVARPVAGGPEKVLGGLDEMDVAEVLFAAKTGELLGYRADTRELGAPPGVSHWIDAKRGRMRFLETVEKTIRWRDLEVVSRDARDRRWVLRISAEERPAYYHLYEPVEDRLTPLFSEQPALEGVQLPRRSVQAYAARDGLPLLFYATQPPPPLPTNPKLVVLLRDRLESRETYAYDRTALWLAARGYVVFQFDTRGSFGFGKRFAAAANKEWGYRVHDDLLDLLERLQAKRPACVVGSGFGGYAALAGVAFTPSRFRCAVAIGAPSDLESWVESTPSHLAGVAKRRIGDLRDVDDVDLLRGASPRRAAERVNASVLLVHGREDREVPLAEAEAMAAALEAAKRPATLVVYDGEGHRPVQPGHVTDLTDRIESFLRTNLGDPYGP